MKSEGGRDGFVESADGDFRIAFGQHDGTVVSPELLFAGAYAGCFHSALESAAKRGHMEIPGLSTTAYVSIQQDDRGGWNLAVELRAAMPGVARRDGEHLMHLAHQSCPYSKALRGSAQVTLTLD